MRVRVRVNGEGEGEGEGESSQASDLVEAELRAGRVVAVAGVDRVAYPREVGRLCEIVAAATRPDEDVVGKVLCE